MDVSELARTADLPELGTAMLDLMGDLFPICRSITGAGLRETLGRIGKVVPLELTEVPTGTTAFDWTVPKEWNVRDAWVADSTGRRVIDFQQSNLHVVNYSGPVRRRLTLDELRPHLHTLPDHPSWVPYRTSLLRRQLGLLPQPGRSSTSCRRASTRRSSTRHSTTAA